jgi:cytosine/adenosine deaminase-related metal-dependent hydrolase
MVDVAAQPGRPTLFRQVRVFDLALAAGASQPTDVLVADGRIAQVGEPGRPVKAPAGAQVIEGAGHHLLAPGLINAHFHSSANHMKGLLPSLPLELFMLYESPELPELAPSPREAYLRTMLGAIEMLRRGVTAVQDDAFFVPAPTSEIVDAVMSAYRDAGLRARVAIDQPELPEGQKLPFLEDLAPAWLRERLSRPPAAGRAAMADLNRHLIETWHGAAGGRLTAAVSVSAPQRVSPEYFGDLFALSQAHDLPLFAHMLETKTQRVLADAQPRFAGRSLVRYTHDLGFLDRHTNVIHAVWVDDADIELIAAAGACVVHNPVSNLRLGSGVMPFRRLRRAGVPVALGSDEAITDDAVNLWTVAKLAGLIHNIGGLDPDQWPGAREVLRCLFEGGARASLQAGELGVVRVGAWADLVLLDLNTLPFTPLNDLPGQLVYCEDGSSVRLTMVAGDVVAREGRLTLVDEAALLAEARELFAGRAAALQAAGQAAQRVYPYYLEMVRRAAAYDVGFSRWVGN